MRYLLVIDNAQNLVLGDADNGVRMPIGEPLPTQGDAQVSTAVWSSAGEWTAWSVDSPDPSGTRQLRIHDEETDEAWVLAESVSAFYMCPSPCGRWLSHLSPGPLGLELAVSDVLSGELQIVERGQPLFWSWSPDGTRLAVHVEDRVVVAGLDGEEPAVLCERAGSFIAPRWLPGGSLAYVVDDRLVASGPDGSVTNLIDAPTSGRFVPDPDGRRLAHIEAFEDGHRLVVTDLLTSEHQVVTTEPIGGFFWSPDGTCLAALVAATAGQVRWLVHDGAGVLELPAFRPSRSWTASVLPFFEQYSLSHSHWSADSGQLVAPALDDKGHSGALIQGAEAPHVEQWVPDAELVWWV